MANTKLLPKQKNSSMAGSIKDYAMYIAFAIIIITFTIMTKGTFLSAKNISDLINQTAYVAVLAIGMTVILIIKHIDLSVGYVAGFIGALAAKMMMANPSEGKQGMSVFIVIPIVLLVGMVIGLYQGTLVSIIGIPAFITTLAGMFIFHGLLLRTTQATGTIIVKDSIFKFLANGFIPDIPGEQKIMFAGKLQEVHVVTIIIGVVGVIAMLAVKISSRKRMQKYDIPVSSGFSFIVTSIISSVLILAIFVMLALYKGLPFVAIIVGVILFVYNFVLSKTRLGRYVYGIGGNAEAAALSGINVKGITVLAFISMSCLAAVSGILYTSRLSSATPDAGAGFELEAIASSYIGGVSVNGGVGKVTNTIIGALIMSSLTSGMNIRGDDISVQYIVKGVIFILAVAFDIISRKKSNS